MVLFSFLKKVSSDTISQWLTEVIFYISKEKVKGNKD